LIRTTVVTLSPEPCRVMAVADHQPMALIVHLRFVPLDVFFDLPLDGRLKRPAGTIAEDVVDDRHGCQSKLKCVSFHEAYPFCPAWDVVNRFVTIHRGYAAFIQTPAIHDFRLYLMERWTNRVWKCSARSRGIWRTEATGP
jgi:hypothetical protein